ncbi:Uncharacterised protein [Cronobacter sakazakii]|nr:Uncharacterised protein [Cronobacter sakazakii]
MAQGKSWSPELEGLRGLASLWVLLGHICLLVQCRIPLLYDPGMGRRSVYFAVGLSDGEELYGASGH